MGPGLRGVTIAVLYLGCTSPTMMVDETLSTPQSGRTARRTPSADDAAGAASEGPRVLHELGPVPEQTFDAPPTHEALARPGWSFGGPPQPPPPATYPRPCHPLFAEDVVPHFEVEIDPKHWARMEEATADGSHEDADEEYYPIVFRHAGDVVTTAMMRLRGNHSDCGTKMQFAISFNEHHKDGRYQGLRRINLDHGGCALMAERLALSYVRDDLGLPAACANHATLTVNGAWYGVFTHLEHLNKDFLDRNFEDDDGNLYKSGRRLSTNEELADTRDLERFRDAREYDELAALMDVDEAVLEWAAEAVLPTPDNFWLHSWNYYLYAHPKRGFLFLPTDLDQALPQSSWAATQDLMFPSTLQFPADVVLADPRGRAKYEAALRRAIDAYDPEVFEARLQRWWTTVEVHARRDPHDSYDSGDVKKLAKNTAARAAWLRDWADAHLPQEAGE